MNSKSIATKLILRIIKEDSGYIIADPSLSDSECARKSSTRSVDKKTNLQKSDLAKLESQNRHECNSNKEVRPDYGSEPRNIGSGVQKSVH